MTFKELRQAALHDYYPALFLERILPRRARSRIAVIAWSSVFLFFILLVGDFTAIRVHPTATFVFALYKIYALFFLALALALVSFALQSFYLYFYYKDTPDIGKEKDLPRMSFGLARIVYRSQNDPLQSFLRSHDGRVLLMRSGISPRAIIEFSKSKKQNSQDSFHIDSNNFLTLTDFVGALFDQYEDFAHFLFGHSIQKKELVAVAEWIIEREKAEKRRRRWWSRDKLGRNPGLGKNWEYGQVYYLEKYTREIPYAEEEYETHAVYGTAELQELEAILVRTRGANAFLIGNDREEQIEIIARLNRLIDDGKALPQLEHKRIVLLDTELLTSTSHSKPEFETKLLQVMHEANYAGNIILVFIDFASFVQSAMTFGSDVVALLDPYFISPDLQIVGLLDTERFHTLIEPNTPLMERFEKIFLQQIDENNTVKVLENEIIPIEHENHVLFTYPALVEIAESAARYFPDALMPDKAIDLMLEIAPALRERRKFVIRKEDVLDHVRSKTGIPVGQIHKDEREKLLGLEKLLHQRIIGQNEAISAIANAVRRARSGINNPNKPLASFLFLGPTGVGKTETTKVLAEIFFGNDAKIQRLDMSEYSSDEALSKLIGSFESGKPGVLTSMLREHPYGVLLLDEFEKTTPEVMNLFLQILDEGMFSDMSGKKINARNLLIIATSNAGADIIWQGLKAGDDFSQAKDYIIDSIIKQGVMKPELINRFDGVIVFHPLGKEELQKVARLQLESLKKRLAERGVNLAVNDELVNYIVQYGVDPKFGARPMNRAIQDKVEQVIAMKMLKGGYKQGQEIVLSARELASS